MLRLSSTRAALAAIRRAHSTVLSAYVLPPGSVLSALAAAARRGASVTVRLEAHPLYDSTGALTALNQAAVDRLKRAGADAGLLDVSGGAGPLLHLKAAVCDGVAFLDDRNWTAGPGTIVVRDTARADCTALRRAILGGCSAKARGPLQVTKLDALHAESQLLTAARHARCVDVATESFGRSSGIRNDLARLAEGGTRCRLVVNADMLTGRTRRDLADLETAGVEVRVGRGAEKFAIVDGKAGWVGSANASAPGYPHHELDWGIRTRDPQLLRGLQGHFSASWRAAKPLPANAAPSRGRRDGKIEERLCVSGRSQRDVFNVRL